MPSEAQSFTFLSRGKGYDYHNLLCKEGGSREDFASSCRGGVIIEKEKSVAKALQKEKRCKDQLRDEVRASIVASVRRYPLPQPVVRD